MNHTSQIFKLYKINQQINYKNYNQKLIDKAVPKLIVFFKKVNQNLK